MHVVDAWIIHDYNIHADLQIMQFHKLYNMYFSCVVYDIQKISLIHADFIHHEILHETIFMHDFMDLLQIHVYFMEKNLVLTSSTTTTPNLANNRAKKFRGGGAGPDSYQKFKQWRVCCKYSQK